MTNTMTQSTITTLLGQTHQAQQAFEKAVKMNPHSRASRRNRRQVSNATALATNH